MATSRLSSTNIGHLLHGIFGGQNQRWAGQSGVATEWDFVEAPSQMLENWVYDYDTLKEFRGRCAGQHRSRATSSIR